ncbi:MAG: hypothetical protein WBE98_06910 [Gammaproteobacteria bacterium]
MTSKQALACLVVWCALASAAVAQTDGGSRMLRVRAGIGYTDNIGRDEEERSETYREAGLDAGLAMSRPRLTGSLASAITYSDYDIDEVTTPLEGSAVGELRAAVVPNAFDWVTSASLGTVRESSTDAPSPLNRQYLRVLMTGPDVFLPLGRRTTLDVSSRYEERDWQRSERLDSDAVTTTVGLFRQVSRTQRLGIAGSDRRVEFDDPLVQRYDVVSYYLSYARQLASGNLDLDVGTTELEYGNEKADGPYVRFSWERGVAARSSLQVYGRREFQDAGDQLSSGFVPDRGIEGEAIVATDPRIVETFGTVYSIDGRKATLSFDVSGRRERAEVEPAADAEAERDSWRAGFALGYPLGPTWTLGLRLSVTEERFESLDGDARQREAQLDLSRPFGRTLRFVLQYERYDRDADFGSEGTENRVRAMVAWEPSRRR